MKIKALGTRGEIEDSVPYHSKHSGVLIDETILFDLGEKQFLEYQPKYIFITHLHPDHAVFVKEHIDTEIPLYAPENFENINIYVPAGEITVDSYSIMPIPTHHSKRVKSTAYLLRKGSQKLLFTGDMIWINKEYHSLFQNVDLVITEGSLIRKGGRISKDKETGQLYGHAGIPDLVNLFKGFTKHILFVHFGSWFYQDMREARAKFKQLEQLEKVAIHVGYDGMQIDLDKLK